MKKKNISGFLAVLGPALLMSPVFAGRILLINGAGATFPYPIYSKWFYEYTKVDASVNFNYQSIGSGGGIKQITAGIVDFGATDGPMTAEQIKAAKEEILHIPMVAGAVAVAFNIPEIKGALKLSPETLADIFLGRVTKWDDKRIAADNKGTPLPDRKIAVVHRSDGSGTTYIFADYLSEVSPAWRKKPGKGTSVSWPVGLGGKGNEGVTGLLKQMPGSIGYVELSYAVKNNLGCAAIKNKKGKYISPSIETATLAVNSMVSRMPSDYRISLVNPDGETAYPICGLTWLLVYRNQKDSKKGEKLAAFLKWAVNEGQKYAPELLYSPLPGALVTKIEKTLGEIKY